MAWKFNEGQPIYSQLVDRFRRKIVTGEYPPGAKLGSVRELALTAAVNPNTMQRALSELERTGLVYAIRTAGRYVTEDPERIARVRRELAEDALGRFLRDMEELGFSPPMVRELLDRAPAAPAAEETENAGETAGDKSRHTTKEDET